MKHLKKQIKINNFNSQKLRALLELVIVVMFVNCVSLQLNSCFMEQK
jgi:hypothetical protein